MIKEILPHLYCLDIPLPNSPLKAINCYVIKGHDRSLVIDTGMNREECKSVLFPGLRELGIDSEKMDIFITHLHADHIGLIGDLASEASKLYFNRTETAIVTGDRHWADLLDFYLSNGFPLEVLKKSVAGHPGFLYNTSRLPEFTVVDDGYTIEVGDFQLTCIETPGHSPGHMCLYDSKRKILFSGDHILFDITPNITYWMGVKDSLRNYLASLDKVRSLEVEFVLPGHRNPWHHHLERINELHNHHQQRLNEAISALEEGEMTAYEVAPCITWNISYKNWEQFPATQKWFAVGETIAHLHYLENDGVISRHCEDGKVYFSLI
jgi:glyoxylase-like metal-dependent hydrolase (beta-lactamase superfamily II)